jgi:anti-sigma factor RsiW
MEPEAMSGTGACAEIRLELGVYVLGVIGGADRSVVDAHLACCANCREELAELAGLPPLLSWATLDDADGLLYRDGCRNGGREHSAHRVPRSLPDHAARLRRRHMRPRLAAAPGACPVANPGAPAGCKRHRAALHRACRAITRQQGGESAR